MSVDIGKHIEQILTDKGMNKTSFAAKMGMTRSNVYDIFSRKTIDTELLAHIGLVLGYNFFQYYLPDNYDNKKQSEKNQKPSKKSRMSLLIEIDPTDEILLNKEFNKILSDLMNIVSK